MVTVRSIVSRYIVVLMETQKPCVHTVLYTPPTQYYCCLYILLLLQPAPCSQCSGDSSRGSSGSGSEQVQVDDGDSSTEYISAVEEQDNTDNEAAGDPDPDPASRKKLLRKRKHVTPGSGSSSSEDDDHQGKRPGSPEPHAGSEPHKRWVDRPECHPFNVDDGEGLHPFIAKVHRGEWNSDSDEFNQTCDGLKNPNVFIARRYAIDNREVLTESEINAIVAEETRLRDIRLEFQTGMESAWDDFNHVCRLCHRRWSNLGPWHSSIVGAGETCAQCFGSAQSKKTNENAHITFAVPLDQLFSPSNTLAPALPDLTAGELQLVSPVQNYMKITTVRKRGTGPGGKTIFKSGVTLVVKKIVETALNVPHLMALPFDIASLADFVIRSHHGTDDDCRRAAGYHCNLKHVLVWLRHLLDNNVSYKKFMDAGMLSVDTDRLQALEAFVGGTSSEYEGIAVDVPGVSGTMAVPVLDEEDDGEGESPWVGLYPTSDAHAANDSGEDPDDPVFLGQERVASVIASITRTGHGARVADVVNGPQAVGGADAYVSIRFPGIEALMFPDLFPDGWYTMRGPQPPHLAGCKSFERPYDYTRHMLMLAGGKFRQHRTFAAVMYQSQIERQVKSQTRFAIDAHAPEITIEEAKAMIEDNDSSIFDTISSYTATLPRTPEYYWRKQQVAKAMIDTTVVFEERHPVFFFTTTCASTYNPAYSAFPAADKWTPEQLKVNRDAGNFSYLKFALADDNWVNIYDVLGRDEGINSLVQRKHLQLADIMSDDMMCSDKKILGKGDQGRIVLHDHAQKYQELGRGAPRMMARNDQGRFYYRTEQGREHWHEFYGGTVYTAGESVDWFVDPETGDLYPPYDTVAGMDWLDSTTEVFKTTLQDLRRYPHSKHPAGGAPYDANYLNLVGVGEPLDESPEAMERYAARVVEDAYRATMMQPHVCANGKCLIDKRTRPYPTPVAKGHAVVVCRGMVVGATLAAVEVATNLLCASAPRQQNAQYTVARATVSARGATDADRHAFGLGDDGAFGLHDGVVLYIECSKPLAALLIDSKEIEVAGKVLKTSDTSEFDGKRVCKLGYPHRPTGGVIARSMMKKVGDGHRVVWRPQRAKNCEMTNPYFGLGGGGPTLKSHNDLQLLPCMESGVWYLMKYAIKYGKFGDRQLKMLKTLLSGAAAHLSDASSAKTSSLKLQHRW